MKLLSIKMLKLTFLIANFFFIAFLFSCHCYGFDNGDFQYWNSESVETKLNENWKIKIEEEFRFGANASTFYENHADIGIKYILDDYLEFTGNYRQIFEKKNKDWDSEYRPHINGTVKIKLHHMDFKDRSRLEYRMRESKDNSWRYRNKLSIDLPFKWTQFDIQPYVADEIFVDFDKGELNRNRLYLGFKMKFLKNLKGEIFYLLQSTKGSEWKNYNVFGTKLKIIF